MKLLITVSAALLVGYCSADGGHHHGGFSSGGFHGGSSGQSFTSGFSRRPFTSGFTSSSTFHQPSGLSVGGGRTSYGTLSGNSFGNSFSSSGFQGVSGSSASFSHGPVSHGSRSTFSRGGSGRNFRSFGGNQGFHSQQSFQPFASQGVSSISYGK